MKKKLLFITNEGPENNIFYSQVLAMTGEFEAAYQADILFRYRDKSASLAKFNIKRVVNLTRLVYMMETRIRKYKQIINDYDILYCRGPVAAYLILKTISKKERKNKLVIYDCRGLNAEEYILSAKSTSDKLLARLRYFEAKFMEKYVVEKSDLFFAVSKNMADYYMKLYNRAADIINPCVVAKNKFLFSEENRTAIRTEYGLNNKTVFLYVGSADKWQRTDLLFEWWNRIKDNDKFAFIILSSQFKAFAELFKEASPNLIIRKADYADIPHFMSAADYGVFFRDDSPVNYVSSPVKLSEYLASGLKIITNQSYFQSRDAESIALVEEFVPLENYDVMKRSISERLSFSEKNSKALSVETAAGRIIQKIEEYQKKL